MITRNCVEAGPESWRGVPMATPILGRVNVTRKSRRPAGARSKSLRDRFLFRRSLDDGRGDARTPPGSVF